MDGTWVVYDRTVYTEYIWHSGAVTLRVEVYNCGAYASLSVRTVTLYTWTLNNKASIDDIKREAVAHARRALNLCLANLASAAPPLPCATEPDPRQERLL